MATLPHALLQKFGPAVSTAAALRPRDIPRQPSGIPALDALTGGLPRGAITELHAPVGAGKATFLCRLLAAATRDSGLCALVDAKDMFDPAGAAASGADLSRLLWVRCHGSLETAFQAMDLLVHGGGFAFLILDLTAVPARQLGKVPSTWWYRFQRTIADTPCSLLVLTDQPEVRQCAALTLTMAPQQHLWRGHDPRFLLLEGARFVLELRKPVTSTVTADSRGQRAEFLPQSGSRNVPRLAAFDAHGAP